MKLFPKKPESETLKTLNEKEIQERLYGKYHVGESKAVNSSNRTAVLPKVETKNISLEDPEVPAFFKPNQKNEESAPKIDFAKFKQIPWKSSAIWIGVIIGLIFAFQFISFLKSIQKNPIRQEVRAVAPAPVSTPKSETKLEARVIKQKETATVKAVTPPIEVKKPTPVTPVAKKKQFAVQVCTYFKESDAQSLKEELTTLNFPAYYQSLPSGHYLVFLGKEDSYEAAQSKLEEFKKTKQFETFPDSFIRSV